MIEISEASINAMIVIVWVLSVMAGGCIGFWLRGLLMASKDKDEKDDTDLLYCVHPTCQRRKTVSGWLNERLLKIGYERYLKQCEKEKAVRVEEEGPDKTAIERTIIHCDACVEFPCVELVMDDDDELLINFTRERLQEILEDGLKRFDECVKKDSSVLKKGLTLFQRKVIRLKDGNELKGTNIDEIV
jgi:hypothetical protein